jgi:hypothetical protein
MTPRREVTEGMVKFAHALVETQHLRAWFYALERLPASVRDTAFSEMAAEMRRDGEDSELADAVAALANAKIYQTILAAVRERVGDITQET